MSGFRSIDFWSKGGFGGFFGEPGAPPVTPLPGMGEQVAGTYLAGGIAAALIGRELTGRGEVVETSLLHSALWSAGLFNATSNYWDNPKKSRHAPDTPLINCFEAKDGAWFCLSIMEYERHWPILCACVGHPELIDSERYSTLRNARTHSAELTALLDEIFAEKNREEWLERFEKADLPAGPIYDAHDILRDRQAFANDYIRPVSFRNGHQAFLPTPPCRFEETGESEWRHAPRIGAHTAEILAELNYTEAEINALIAGKAVGGR
jgi:crotonobetainyl-CoA:carnitine CoA-transferase CaiB-like acyl-CoA transferase